MTISETLAAIAVELERTGVERQDLAARLRVTPSTLRRWFAGTRKPEGPATLALEAELEALRRAPSRRVVEKPPKPDPGPPRRKGRPPGSKNKPKGGAKR